MLLHEWLGLPEAEKHIVSLCGAGGKTTLMHSLACECCQSMPTAMFTTTHILPPAGEDICLMEPFSQEECAHIWAEGKIAAAGSFLQEEYKFGAPSENVMRFLCREAQAVFIEADGSKCLPLKFPDKTREPQLRPETTHVIAVAGLSSLGKPIESVFHRLALAKEKLGITEETVTEELMAKTLWAGYGEYSPVFLLNQADTPELAERGAQVAQMLRSFGAGRCVVASLQNPENGVKILC